MTPILKLKGLGPALAKNLMRLGIKSVEDLAKASVETLQEAPGLGPNRIARFQTSARQLLNEAGTSSTPAVSGSKARIGETKDAPNAPIAVDVAQTTKTKPVEPEITGVDKSLAVAEAARLAAEEKAAKAEAKASKAAKKARALMAEFAAAKEKAKSKAKKQKGKAKKDIAKEKAKEKKILAEKSDVKEKTAGKKSKGKKKKK